MVGSYDQPAFTMWAGLWVSTPNHPDPGSRAWLRERNSRWGGGGGLPLHTLLPEAVQARGLQVHTVNSAQDLVHGRVYGLPLAGLQAWQRGVFVDDAWAVLHQVEGGTDDAGGDTDGVGHFSGRQPWCPPPRFL